MGLYDRDYWRERFNKRTGFREKARFRLGEDEADDLADHAYFRPSRDGNRKPTRPWHPVLQVLLFAFICYAVLFLLTILER